MLNVIFIVGVIALRHLPTLLNVDVDVDVFFQSSRKIAICKTFKIQVKLVLN